MGGAASAGLDGRRRCAALLRRADIAAARGQWIDVLGRSTLPTFHPSFLLSTGRQRGLARPPGGSWSDLNGDHYVPCRCWRRLATEIGTEVQVDTRPPDRRAC